MSRPPFEIMLKELSHNRTTIPLKSKSKYRIAHVAQQLVDKGHAPSHLIGTLIEQCDFNRFEPHLILTEALQYHPDDYPANLYWSNSSNKRAKEHLEKLERMNVPIWMESPNGLFEERVRFIADLIKEQAIDCVIFHGADVTHTMATQLCCSPLRVLFEHGTLPKYPGFDLAIVSTEVILSGRRQDHVNLTLQLIQDPLFYTSRSKHAIACYNKHADVKAYVKEFEEIISTSLRV